MSGTPHPTLEGVTVKIDAYSGPYQGDVLFYYRDLELADSLLGVSASTQRNEIRVTPGFSPRDTEKVVAMIRDQQEWLASQGETN